MTAERTVVLVAYEGINLLDLCGPLEALRVANLAGASPAYRTVVATPDGRRVRSASGLEIGADASVADLAGRRTPVDTLLVADVAAIARRTRRVTSVCTGAFVLAAAGLLDGRRATTHWAACAALARQHPAIDVEDDRIYVRDGHCWTSAGVTAGIDLTLALVEEDNGPEVAHQVAGWLVVFTRRPGGQAQFSAALQAQPAVEPGIAAVQRWLPDHLADDLSVDALARRASMSPRTFARAFRRETGTTPAAHVETLRVEAARRLLETTDLTVPAVARAVGLRRAETLHRAFRRRVGTTPEQYRRHFALSA